MRIRLRSRLFFSHLIVMLVGLISFLVISQSASHHIFSGHLDEIEGLGFAIRETRELVLDGFEAPGARALSGRLSLGL